MTEFGFVAEPHRDGYFLVSPATKRGDKIECHDLSGFLGSWDMKTGGVFFASTTGDCLCPDAMSKANEYSKQMNEENK